MRVLVNVKQEHIDKGVPGTGDTCPISLALEEKFPEYSWWVYYTKVGISIPNSFSDYIDIQQSAQRFIGKFDYHKPVKPFGFYFNIPDWILEDARSRGT